MARAAIGSLVLISVPPFFAGAHKDGSDGIRLISQVP